MGCPKRFQGVRNMLDAWVTWTSTLFQDIVFKKCKQKNSFLNIILNIWIERFYFVIDKIFK